MIYVLVENIGRDKESIKYYVSMLVANNELISKPTNW